MSFKIERNETVGRFAVADKDLSAGDTIFDEKPFAFGPKSDHPPMCLGCYLPVDCSNLCSSCRWPVCGPECEQNPAHKNAECQVFSKAKVPFQPIEDATQINLQYECITPLRVLLAKEADSQRWESEVAIMESHNEKRKQLPVWRFYEINVVEYLRGPCQLDRFSAELIHTVIGILEINAFEAHPTNGGYSIRCLYPKLAILSHNCVSNIAHSIRSSDFCVNVRAAVNIKSGEELFSSYTYSMLPTLVRRAFLKESKYFECACKRCSDPTELGTHMGTLKCSKCDNGVIVSTSPLDFEAKWKCTICEFTTTASAVQRVYQAFQSDIDNVDALVEEPSQAIEVREALFRKYRSAFHPRNSYHSMLRVALAQMYGKIDGYTLDDLPDLLLERKIELCKELLQNLDVIEPGLTRIRGMTLYELHAPLILVARNFFRSKLINKAQLRRKLEETVKILNEAATILMLEPDGSTEKHLGLTAFRAKVQLETNLDELVNAEF